MDCIFYRGKEVVIVRLIDTNLSFCKLQGSQLMFAPIEGLQFSEAGIHKEHPDLSEMPFGEAKRIAIQRLKDKLKSLQTEKERVKYLKEDLEKFGYVLKIISKEGCRPLSFKNYIKS